MVRTHTARRTYASVGHIKRGLTDTELQNDLGQTNASSIQTYKRYYEETERPKVFDLKFEE